MLGMPAPFYRRDISTSRRLIKLTLNYGCSARIKNVRAAEQTTAPPLQACSLRLYWNAIQQVKESSDRILLSKDYLLLSFTCFCSWLFIVWLFLLHEYFYLLSTFCSTPKWHHNKYTESKITNIYWRRFAPRCKFFHPEKQMKTQNCHWKARSIFAKISQNVPISNDSLLVRMCKCLLRKIVC